jgi:hypothetical protein
MQHRAKFPGAAPATRSRRAAPPSRPAPRPAPTGSSPGWKDGRLVGLEILDASTRLHSDLLETAEIIG